MPQRNLLGFTRLNHMINHQISRIVKRPKGYDNSYCEAAKLRAKIETMIRRLLEVEST